MGENLKKFTDKELEEHVIQVLMHEAGHAAHENIDLPTPDNDKGWYNLMSNTKDLFQKEMVAQGKKGNELQEEQIKVMKKQNVGLK